MANNHIDNYSDIYQVNPIYRPILERLDKAYWYLFNGKKETSCILITGFYSGYGPSCQRVDITHIVEKACKGAGFKTEIKNVAPRGGVKGNRLIVKL